LLAYGALAGLLISGGGWEGIFPLLGEMNEVPPENGVPGGYAGTSGMRIYHPKRSTAVFVSGRDF
jgi:hypothetical protein